jgi:hypothetical protein
LSAGIKLGLLLILLPAPAAAQGFLEQFSYEGLRLSGIGVEFGAVASDRIERRPSGAVRVDYGMIAPKVRVVFGAAYFRGDFNDEEIRKFEARLRDVVVLGDPGGSFTVDVGRIALTDVEADLNLQYLFDNGPRLITYLGLGAGVHVRNGSGDAIDGTFVEDALDTVAAGLALSIGADFALARAFHLTLDLRGGLTSELRTASARGGFMYRLPSGGGP